MIIRVCVVSFISGEWEGTTLFGLNGKLTLSVSVAVPTSSFSRQKKGSNRKNKAVSRGGGKGGFPLPRLPLGSLRSPVFFLFPPMRSLVPGYRIAGLALLPRAWPRSLFLLRRLIIYCLIISL